MEYCLRSCRFINAIEVKIQPDDAEWDAKTLDIMYSDGHRPQIRFWWIWTEFLNPRTGEIIGADIMLNRFT